MADPQPCSDAARPPVPRVSIHPPDNAAVRNLLANRLGHDRTSTTMDIYWAFVPARDRDAADHLEAILRPV